ncbi:MAG: tyrosine-type recombinase/integrase [Comamonadaceae bacterium]|nr:tyrosine-type recombinase/integrase [Comamonadaceae bacterium]
MPEITGYSDHITPMVLLSLNTGMRQGELFSLAWESVDLSRKTITVLASHSQGNTTRVIPLKPEALAVLKTIKPEHAKGLVSVASDRRQIQQRQKSMGRNHQVSKGA